MATALLTKKYVDNIVPPADGKRLVIWDTKLSGFGIRVTSKGVISYVVQYRMGGRNTPTELFTLGQHGNPLTTDEARRAAAELLAKVRLGKSPKLEKQARLQKEAKQRHLDKHLEFASFTERFIEDYARAKKLKSADDIAAVFRRDLVPSFAGTSIANLTRGEISLAIRRIGQRSPSAANKAYRMLNVMLNWAVEIEAIDTNPMSKLKLPFPEQSRERVLSDSELWLVWKASFELGYPFGHITRMLILCGQRLREVAGMRWQELDLESKTWTIPSDRSKNKRRHVVPLSEAALTLISEIQAFAAFESEYVFTTTGHSPPSGFSKAKARLDIEVAKLCSSAPAQAPKAWTFHDLRRTFATRCQQLGMPTQIIEALINHVGSRGGIVRVYQTHDYADEKRAAMTQWAKQLLCIVDV